MNDHLADAHADLDDQLRSVADGMRGPDIDALLTTLRDDVREERVRRVRRTRPRARRTWRVIAPLAGVAAVALFAAFALSPDDDARVPRSLRLDEAAAAQVLRDAALLVAHEPQFSRASGPWLASTTTSLRADGTPDPAFSAFEDVQSWIGPDGRTLDVVRVDFTAMRPVPADAATLGTRVGITLRGADASFRAIEFAPGSSEPLARSVQAGRSEEALIAGVPARFVRGLPSDVDALARYLPTYVDLPGGFCHAMTQGGQECGMPDTDEQLAVNAAINLLTRAPIDAPQRSALYRFLAEHAVSGRTDAVDRLGRSGIALRFDGANGRRTELMLDPGTGEVLQTLEWLDGQDEPVALVIREQAWVQAPVLTGHPDVCGGAQECDVLERLRSLERDAEGDRLPQGHYYGDGVIATN